MHNIRSELARGGREFINIGQGSGKIPHRVILGLRGSYGVEFEMTDASISLIYPDIGSE